MRTLLAGGHVFDPADGTIAAADVVLEGERIVDIGSDLDGDTAIDCSGHTLLPGLFDCHVHLTMSGDLDWVRSLQRGTGYQFMAATRNLSRTLDIGITTVRDAGFTDLGVKQAV